MQFLFGQNINNRSLDIDENDIMIKLSESFIVEKKIDSETYFLGPGDKLGLSIISNSNATYILTVTPSGLLWIPDLGSIIVSGLTIYEAQDAIHLFIKQKKFNSAEITLVLLNIRKFRIQIIGAVLSPGFINVSTVERLSDIVKKAGGLHKSANEEKISIERNGLIIDCSLKEFQVNGNLDNNPILYEGDVIKVPFEKSFLINKSDLISHKQSLVLITGYVLNPSTHKYIPGYSVMDYIAMSGGVSDRGSINKLTLYRHGEKKIANLNQIVMPGDQINIAANIKFKYLGDISILQTITAIMSLYLTFVAATN